MNKIPQKFYNFDIPKKITSPDLKLLKNEKNY